MEVKQITEIKQVGNTKDIRVKNTTDTVKVGDMAGRCGYPGCSEGDSNKFWDLPIRTRTGLDKKGSLRVNFCKYHFFVVCGGEFHCEKVRGSEYRIRGPLKGIALIEQVIAAREMTKTKTETKTKIKVETKGGKKH